MGPVFIAIADTTRARIYQQAQRGAPLRLVEELLHPESGLRNKDLVTDRAGVKSQGNNSSSFGGAHPPPKEMEAQKFARDIAARLDKANKAGELAELVLVMGPRMLGAVKSALSEGTAKKIAAAIDSDVAGLDDEAIAAHLRAGWFVGRNDVFAQP